MFLKFIIINTVLLIYFSHCNTIISLIIPNTYVSDDCTYIQKSTYVTFIDTAQQIIIIKNLPVTTTVHFAN